MTKITFLRRLLLPIIYILLTLTTVCLSEECDENGSCINPDTVRVITVEELSTKTGKERENDDDDDDDDDDDSNINNDDGVEGGEVWIAILGQVFDVTNGSEYYGPGAGYSIFAGQDASACFATGEFNEEGAKKDLEDLEDKQIKSVVTWRQFYWDEEKYTFVGVLDDLYYNKNGNPTSKLNRITKRIASIDTTKS